MADFLSFRAKKGVFSPTAPCWTQATNPLRFWQLHAIISNGLGTLAVRLFSTPANTVPSERAFSAQNLIHDKKRNRLSSEKANKLVYIHMNQRILESLDRQQTTKDFLQNIDELCLENEILHATEDTTVNENKHLTNNVELHKRKSSSQIAHRPIPPSLRTQLTDDLETIL